MRFEYIQEFLRKINPFDLRKARKIESILDGKFFSTKTAELITNTSKGNVYRTLNNTYFLVHHNRIIFVFDTYYTPIDWMKLAFPYPKAQKSLKEYFDYTYTIPKG